MARQNGYARRQLSLRSRDPSQKRLWRHRAHRVEIHARVLPQAHIPLAREQDPVRPRVQRGVHSSEPTDSKKSRKSPQHPILRPTFALILRT